MSVVQTCVKCQTLMGWPSEVLRGQVVGVCGCCGHIYGEPLRTSPTIDPRGQPSQPGAS